MDKSHKYLQLAALAAGMLIPCVVMAGYVSYLGYTVTFGLTPDLISKGFGEVIAESWGLGVTVLTYFLPKLGYLFVLALAYIFFVIFVMHLVTYLQDSLGLKSGDEKITKENQGRDKFGLSRWKWIIVLESVGQAALWIMAPLILAIFTVWILAFPYEYGRDQALKQITVYQSEGCASEVGCYQLVDFSGVEGEVIIEGLIVSVNDRRIAFFSGGRVEVYPLLDRFKLVRGYGEGNGVL